MTETPVVNHIHRAVVAGVDGSNASWTAVRAAAWEAIQRGQDLVLVHGYYERMPYMAYGWSPYVPTVEDVFEGPRTLLAETARKVREVYPDLAVHTELMPGGGADVLIQLSRVASLIVVGSRGHGGFAGLSLGSVAAQTAAHAASPVMVIRSDDDTDDAAEPPTPPTTGPVVVGIGGSPYDEGALRFAFEEASLRGVDVIAIHVWSYPDALAIRAEPVLQYDQDEASASAERVVAEALAGWSAKYPDVTVGQRTVAAMNTSSALIEESAGAGLVVVGCRGRGGFTGLLLGSVSRDLVGHAHAPVTVVHDHQ